MGLYYGINKYNKNSPYVIIIFDPDIISCYGMILLVLSV